MVPATASARCLTEAKIDAALGEQIRADVPFIDRSTLPDLPLCSGLTLGQQVQRMRAALHPEEQRQREEEQARLIEQENAAARSREAQAAAQRAQAAALDEPADGGWAAPTPVAAIAVPVPRRASAGRTKAKAAPAKRKASSRSSSHASYRSCREARAAGAAPVYRGSPGYAPHLDRDNDGVACE
ncbi:excalibur calcium-binding domain-containing protein [Novosphingobium colocasiae]|nr:excalibur calcium-binding domain-containing protein [Novosphingobium colocasiae]